MVGHAFGALPRSEQFRPPGSWWAHCPRWTVHLNRLPGPECAVTAPSLVCRVSPLGRSSRAATLLAHVNRSCSQEDMVSNRGPAHSLLEDASLWGWDCLLPPTSLPLVGEGHVHNWLALVWYLLNPLFCTWARLRVRLEPFTGKFFFFCLVIPQFGLFSHVSSLWFSSGHSDPVLTLGMKPMPPCPALTCWWWTGASGLLLHWEWQLGVYSDFFFFLPVMLSSEIPKLPTEPQVRGFPAVWKLPLLHDSLPRMFSVPNSISLFLSFIFCPTYFQREWAAVLGSWCPPPASRSCFVELAQHSNDLLMNL